MTKNTNILIRCTIEERESLKAVAKANKLTLSEYMLTKSLSLNPVYTTENVYTTKPAVTAKSVPSSHGVNTRPFVCLLKK